MKMDSSYIKENGLLELYLLGELSQEETAQIEQILANDGELRAMKEEHELVFEKMAMENEVKPSSSVKGDLMQSIIAPIPESKPRTSFFNSKLAFYAAASIALLLMINSIRLFTQLSNSNSEMEQLRVETDALKEEIENMNNRLSITQELLAEINNPRVEKLIMRGNSLSPNSVAVAYLNEEDKKVILNCSGLAELDENLTYQMWADVDGEMINMGVIPRDQEMIAMTFIEDAESFNITIEPAGGNDHPTVERLITNVVL